MSVKKGKYQSYTDFAIQCNSLNLTIEKFDEDYFGLEDYEEIIDGEIVDLRADMDYINQKMIAENQNSIAEFKKQIEELDKKRIRAICEPAIKDDATSETWLEYYNQQVVDLRTSIRNLEEEIENVIE